MVITFIFILIIKFSEIYHALYWKVWKINSVANWASFFLGAINRDINSSSFPLIEKIHEMLM